VSGHDEREDYDDEPWRKRRPPDESIRWAASTIWAFGQVQLILSGLGFFFAAWVAILTAFDEGIGKDAEPFEVVLFAASSVAAIAWNAVVIRAANRMRQFRRYRLAVLGSAMSVLPVPFFYFAIFSFPLGVYSFILLMRSDVRARFAAVARGTMKAAPPEAPDARRTDAA
jgi:hypothetical protein